MVNKNWQSQQLTFTVNI